MAEHYSDLPLGCAHRNACYTAINKTHVQVNQIEKLTTALDQADARVLEAEAALELRTISVEISRAQETIKRLQSVDLVQRRTIDALEEECSRLRTIMRTNGFDLDAVDAIITETLTERVGRQAPDVA